MKKNFDASKSNLTLEELTRYVNDHISRRLSYIMKELAELGRVNNCKSVDDMDVEKAKDLIHELNELNLKKKLVR